MIDIFLAILALIWLAIASLSDLKKREIPNWLSFSLIIFALAYRAFFAVLNYDLWFFVYGIVGFVLFVGFGYLFYYARVFAGGDAKLLMAMGVIFPVSLLVESAFYSFSFIFLLLIVGGFYGLAYSLFLAVKNSKNFGSEFVRQFWQNRILFLLALIIGFLGLGAFLYLKESLFLLLLVILLAFPFLYSYAKAVEKSCMIKLVSVRELTEGDWLYENVKVGRKVIKPYWEGLNSNEIRILKQHVRKIKIKQGIPFVPAFLIAFAVLVFLSEKIIALFF